MSGFKQISRIALGLASISCLLLLLCDYIGLIPNQSDRISGRRNSIAESLVTQATISKDLDDMRAIRAHIEYSRSS